MRRSPVVLVDRVAARRSEHKCAITLPLVGWRDISSESRLVAKRRCYLNREGAQRPNVQAATKLSVMVKCSGNRLPSHASLRGFHVFPYAVILKSGSRGGLQFCFDFGNKKSGNCTKFHTTNHTHDESDECRLVGGMSHRRASLNFQKATVVFLWSELICIASPLIPPTPTPTILWLLLLPFVASSNPGRHKITRNAAVASNMQGRRQDQESRVRAVPEEG